jgi:hypothetical protein
MAYRIKQFDGLVLTDITMLPQNGSNDLGAGDALTSFAQLPGGGFFDNHGENDAPQGIRPIARNCVLWGDTTEELIENLKAIRSKIGRRGRLAIQFDTGEIWWQWARLRRCHTPRPREAVGNFLPCNLQFETASQVWYGVEQGGETWEVGDDSFYLGDGTVSLGMNEYTYELTDSLDEIDATLPNDGNTFVRNMSIRLTTDEDLDSVTIRVTSTGQYLLWENSGLTGPFTLIIDTGSKLCVTRDDDSIKPMYVIGLLGLEATVQVDDPSHGLATGDSIEIVGTEYFDGIYHNITSLGDSAFSFTVTERFIENVSTESLTGSVYKLSDAWSGLTVYDRKNWFMLFPGDNIVNVNLLGGGLTPLQDYSISFAWYDHYK